MREYRLDIPSENIRQTAETDPEADQGEALFNAVNHSDWQTVRPLLERYTQQTEYDPDIALFARASLARGEGRWKDAKQDYETLLQRHPDFTRGRLDYARLLFEGRLNREATSEFMRLQTKTCPKPSRKHRTFPRLSKPTPKLAGQPFRRRRPQQQHQRSQRQNVV